MSCSTFNEKQELTLLSAWTMKQHENDLQHFEEGIFTYKSWFSALKDAKSYEQMKASNILPSMTYTEMVALGTDTFAYTDARATALKEQRDYYLDKAKQNKFSHYTDKAQRIQDVIDGKTEATNTDSWSEYFITELEAEMNEQNPQWGRGFEDIDKITRGIHRGELTTVGARPGVGKTAFALQVAYNVAIDQDYKTLFIPLEMKTYENLRRILLYSQVVEPEEMYCPTKDSIKETKRMLDDLEKIGTLQFCEGLNNIGDIQRKVHREKPFLVIIDQLTQLYPYESYSGLREKYIANTKELKRLALEENVAIVLLSQINRDSKDKEPTIENLSESDSIAQYSDACILLFTQNDASLGNDARVTVAKIAKHRNGQVGTKIPLVYNGSRFTYSRSTNNGNSRR